MGSSAEIAVTLRSRRNLRGKIELIATGTMSTDHRDFDADCGQE